MIFESLPAIWKMLGQMCGLVFDYLYGVSTVLHVFRRASSQTDRTMMGRFGEQ